MVHPPFLEQGKGKDVGKRKECLIFSGGGCTRVAAKYQIHLISRQISVVTISLPEHTT